METTLETELCQTSKKSSAFESKSNNIITWIRQGELEASKIGNNNSFRKKRI